MSTETTTGSICDRYHTAAHVREPVLGTGKIAVKCQACGRTWIEVQEKRLVTIPTATTPTTTIEDAIWAMRFEGWDMADVLSSDLPEGWVVGEITTSRIAYFSWLARAKKRATVIPILFQQIENDGVVARYVTSQVDAEAVANELANLGMLYSAPLEFVTPAAKRKMNPAVVEDDSKSGYWTERPDARHT